VLPIKKGVVDLKCHPIKKGGDPEPDEIKTPFRMLVHIQYSYLDACLLIL